MALTAFASLRATALTSRCHNPFFRREQLKFLHDVLRQEIKDISDAIRQDTSCTNAEATIEIGAALSIIKEHHASIIPNQELKDEYGPAHGKDPSGRTEPWGVVYIEPNLGHTPFLSVVAPLSAAIATGNCVALKLENTPRALPSLLRTLLPRALQADTFQIIPTSPPEESMTDILCVLQKTSVDRPTHTQLVSPSGRVIAVVDRTADLSSAAAALVAARFSFGGTSPYAPNLIFVNEFSKKEFVEQVLKHAIRFLASTEPNGALIPAKQSRHSMLTEELKSLEGIKDWTSTVITQGSGGAIISLASTSPTQVPLPPRFNAPILAISTISSLDHAIDMIANDSDERLTAAYHFAAGSHAKYLSQFINSEISFINHIPPSLRLGPAAPLFHPISPNSRYTPSHFTRSAPLHVTPHKSISTSSDDATEVLKSAAKEIQVKRAESSIAVGFFQRGVFIGLGFYGVPILTCLGGSLFFAIRAGLRKWI